MLNACKIEILQYTQSVCSICLMRIKAEYIEKEGKIYLRKHCSEHGEREVLISTRSNDYKELLSYYSAFGLGERTILQSLPDQISVFPTTKCNLRCPVCFADCGISDKDVSVEDVIKAIQKVKHKKINILGGEATIYPELPLLIREILRTRNTPVLFTNGIKIADDDYVNYLNNLGIKEVHLQFDGVDDNVYQHLRNSNLLKYKLQALEKLNKLGIKVVLETLIDGRINSNQIGDIINLALRYNNIKGINFRAYFILGKKEDRDGLLLLDDLLKLAEEQTNGNIGLKEILEFQKILYALASIFGIKVCLKHRFFIVYREKGNNFISINKMFNLKCLNEIIKRFKELKQNNSKIAYIYLSLHLVMKLPVMVDRKNISIIINYIGILIRKKVFGVSISKELFRDRSLMVNFERPCDRDTFDLNEICDNMVIDSDGRSFRTFYLASIERERLKINTPYR